ncbi:MAG: hypothetical protein OXG37_04750 [Actinomycetia bacterium]|nr:hypothetical protein [Actinomycetes bacterium]
MRKSIQGLPEWFQIDDEPEAVSVVDHARVGRARLGSGEIYKTYLDESKRVPDAIIADSADSLADTQSQTIGDLFGTSKNKANDAPV